LGSLNLTSQNDRILIFWTSWGREPYATHLGRMINRSVDSFILGGTQVEGALPDCERFKADKYGIVITGFGENDWYYGVPWEQTETDLRQLFQCLKDSGAIVVYVSVLSQRVIQAAYGFDYQPFDALCREEGVLVAPSFAEDIVTSARPGELVFNPYFDSGDRLHPNEEGYSVFAERTARVLLETGLAQPAQTCEGLSEQIPAMLSHAMDLIEAMEEKGADIQQAMKYYGSASYLYENQFYYTANWSLRERIIGPMESCLAGWDQISRMLDAANESIKALEQAGIDTARMRGDYALAQTYWQKYQYEETNTSLSKIVTDAGGVLDSLPEISEMFSRTSELIEDAKDKGMDTQQMDRSYNRAKIYWGQYEVERTREELLKIIPDMALLPLPPALALALLLALTRPRPRKNSPVTMLTDPRQSLPGTPSDAG
jgi:hypothetical protein